MTIALAITTLCATLSLAGGSECAVDDLVRPPYFLPVNTESAGQLLPIVADDFDGDGFEDLLAVNRNSNPATIDLFLSRGRGGFSSRTRYETTSTPTDLILADVDGDQRLDLVFLDDAADSFAVRLGQGGTSFGPEARHALPAPSARIVAGDTDGDGDTDLAFAGGTLSDGIRILLNDGTGVFSPGPLLEAATRWDAVGLGDLNNDGALDLIVANSTAVLARLNDGAGGFLASSTQSVNGPVQRLTLDDLDLDGSLDVVAGASDAHVLFGNGDGTLAPQLVLDTFNARFSLVSRDFNGDSLPDLVSVGINETLYLYTNDGDRTFTDERLILSGGGPASPVVAGDFDHDGLPDIARLNATPPFPSQYRGLAIAPGDGNGSFTQPSLEQIPGRVSDVLADDINTDGLPDLLLTSYDTDEVLLRMNTVAGGFEDDVRLTSASAPRSLDTGDFNGDGLLDVVVLSDPLLFPGVARAHIQQPAGVFTSMPLVAPISAGRVRVVDADGDTDADLLFDRGPGPATISRGNGDGTFTAGHAFEVTPGSISSVRLDDVDGDGIPDAVASTSLSELVLFSGLGAGTFSAMPVPLGIPSNFGFELIDLNNDGAPDILTSTTVALGNGDGTFTPTHTLDAPSNSVFELADLDNDGVPDVINFGPSSPQQNNVTLLRGHGDGTFESAVPLAALSEGGLYRVATADFSGDGSTDLFLARDPDLAITSSLIELRSVCPAAPPCPADCDASGSVDFNDLVAILFEFGAPDPSGACDADVSGGVDFNDLVAALFLFGPCP